MDNKTLELFLVLIAISTESSTFRSLHENRITLEQVKSLIFYPPRCHINAWNDLEGIEPRVDLQSSLEYHLTTREIR